MVKGLYTAYTGLLNQQYKLDVISNNLANASTTAYKAEGTTARAFDDVLAYKINDSSVYNINQNIGSMSLGVEIGETYTCYDQGSLVETDETYDLAIEGNGFFAISYTDDSGDTTEMYTRDGEFTVDSEGALRTNDGDYVLSTSGEYIYIPTTAASVEIDSDGNIYADDEYVDSIKIVDFEDYDYLEKFGDNLYQAVDGATETDFTGTVNQGYLEASNVNVVDEMVDMIEITRAYETNQKIMQSIDDTLDKAVNQVGRL